MRSLRNSVSLLSLICLLQNLLKETLPATTNNCYPDQIINMNPISSVASSGPFFTQLLPNISKYISNFSSSSEW